MSFADDIRRASEHEVGCEVDLISMAITGKRARCFEGPCGACRKHWVERMVDAIEAEQSNAVAKALIAEVAKPETISVGLLRDVARDLEDMAKHLKGAVGEDLAHYAALILKALDNPEANASKPTPLPDGVEWPRFEDGEPVRFGDWFVHPTGEEAELDSVRLLERGYQLNGWCNLHAYGEPVKRPETIGADGKPILIGETVHGEDGRAWKVTGFDYRKKHRVEAERDGAKRQLRPEWLKHELPVLDADGKPIKVGDTVYSVKHHTCKGAVRSVHRAGEVVTIAANLINPNRPFVVHDGLSGNGGWDYAESLTHRKPDTQEAIDADAAKTPCLYFCKKNEYECSDCPQGNGADDADYHECNIAQVRDLLRRQRRLMGVDA